MDVVADAGAVRCRIVVAEDLEPLVTGQESTDRDRDQVERVGPVLTDSLVEAGTSGVEVPEAHAPDAVDLSVPVQDPFRHRLGLRIDGLRSDGLRLVDGDDGRGAVHRARRREHELAHTRSCGCVEQVHGSVDVVVEVLRGQLHRLPDVLVGREVHDRVDPVLATGLLDDGLVGDVGDDELRVDDGVGVAQLE